MKAAFAEMPQSSVSPGSRSHTPFAASSQSRGMFYRKRTIVLVLGTDWDNPVLAADTWNSSSSLLGR